MSAAVIAVALVLGVAQVAADLPVHCPHHVNVGNWEFSMVSRPHDFCQRDLKSWPCVWQSEGNQPKTVSCNKKPTQTQMCFYGSCFTNKATPEQ